MTAQDLTPYELKTCALLYSDTGSIITNWKIFYEMNGAEFAPFMGVMMPYNEPAYRGTWMGKPFYTADKTTIQLLTSQWLLIQRYGYKYEFYSLNIQNKHKEFFKELKVQIALGSI